MAGVISVWLAEETEDPLGSASGLTSLDLALVERQPRNHFLHFLQFIGVVSSVVLFGVFWVLVEAQANEKGGGRGVHFPLDLQPLIKGVLGLLDILVRLVPRRFHIIKVFLSLVGELLFLLDLVFRLSFV